MYPYKIYDIDKSMMVYNHDGSFENEIAITVDKIVNETLLSTDARLVDIIYKCYQKSSIECDDDIQAIINNWLRTGNYKHIYTLLGCYMGIQNSFNLY